MSPDHFRACLDALSWSGRGLAERLGVDERQVRRWANGQYRIPPPIAEWLDRVALFHERNPPPPAK